MGAGAQRERQVAKRQVATRHHPLCLRRNEKRRTEKLARPVNIRALSGVCPVVRLAFVRGLL